MRSTDKDLLVAQRVLAPIRFPSRKDLVDKAQARDSKALQRRVVQIAVKGKIEKVQQGQKRIGLYDLNATFEVRGIPYKDDKYTANVTFNMPFCFGQGVTSKDREHDAKDCFRNHISMGLREDGSDVRDAFFRTCTIVGPHGLSVPNGGPIFNVVAELFRKWIGNNLRKVDGKYRERFFQVCRHAEREIHDWERIRAEQERAANSP